MDRLIPFILAAAVLIAVGEGAATPSYPKMPDEPAKPGAAESGEGSVEVAASIVSAGGEEIKGVIILESSYFEVHEAHGAAGSRNIAVGDIRLIEFAAWRGKKRRIGEYAFYPSRVTITLVDGSRVESAVPIQALLRFRFRSGRRALFFYTYFYDYRKGEVWVGSGKKEPDYPERHPDPKTIIRIDFVKEEGGSLLDYLFR